MNTQRMLVDTSSGNRMYVEDIQYGANIYTEVFRGGLGITGSTNTGVFKILGLTVNGNSIQFNKGTVLIYYNGTSSSTIVDSDQIAVCRYNGNVVSVAVGSSINLYVGYNEISRVNESGSNYVAYIDFFFQTTSFSGSKLTLNIPANLTVPELFKQYGWNYPVNDSFTIDLINTPIDAQDILTGGSVGTEQLADKSVTSSKIANGSVGTEQLDITQVNGMFFDYTISNISQFGTVFNNILSKGSLKVRILGGEYNITNIYNLGNTSSNNIVEVYCDPDVVINGFLSTNIPYNFSVNRDSGFGGVIWHGGIINPIYQSGKNDSAVAVFNGLSGFYDAVLSLPQNPTTIQTSVICLAGCYNIDNIIVKLLGTSYSSTQSGKMNTFFRLCENISNILIDAPLPSTNNAPYVRIFESCSNISNVKIKSLASNKYMVYFLWCNNISNVNVNITGNFPINVNMLIYLFRNSNNISNFEISIDNYGRDSLNQVNITLFYNCININNGQIKLIKPSSGSWLSPMINVIHNSTSVSKIHMTGGSPVENYIVNSKGVTNNVLYTNEEYTSDEVYSDSYCSFNNSNKCGITALGGFNYVIQS